MYRAALLVIALDLCQLGAKTTHASSRAEIVDDFWVIGKVWCDSAPLDAPNEHIDPLWTDVTHVVLTGCGPPTPPDPPALIRMLAARGVPPTTLKVLELKEIPPDAKFNASHFAELNSLQQLDMQAAGDGRPQQLSHDFLRSLPSLIWLMLENEALPPLPPHSPVRSVSLISGRSLGAWGDCDLLIDLHLRDWLVPADGSLMHCKRLQRLAADHMELNSLKAAMLGLGVNRTDFITLELPDNALTTADLKYLLEHSALNVVDLSLPRNNLTHIDNVLVAQKRLLHLDLSHNKLSDLARTLRALSVVGRGTVGSVRDKRNSFNTLQLDYNPLRDYCADSDRASSSLHPWEMSLVGTNTSQLCFSDWNELNKLNLSNNNIEELQFGQLPLAMDDYVHPLTVDLSDNPLRKVYFNETHYNALNDSRRSSLEVVTVITNPLPPLDCECREAWLARALREGRVVLPAGVRCLGGGPLRDAPRADLECDLTPCEPCQCRRQWESGTLRVFCVAKGLHALPELTALTELHLRDNHIRTIRAEDLNKTLMLLDVRDNNVTRVDAAAAAALFEVAERHVWLSGNPLACDCDNWPLLGALQAHHVQVEDYENVTCSDGRSLQDVRWEQLCYTGRDAWVALTAGGGVLIGLVALGGALYARYERPLKVWLYARGWCLCCVREEELDADREYDVFLSFAYGDHEFVADNLLPELEGGRCRYKVCVHYRDWAPGEMIPTQITRSVEASRRTVIVLSAHFVHSVWGLMEFRAAHVSALAEGRVRLLVVVLDDAPKTDELTEELRLYLRSTTYLRWDDPRFWDKFRYALPHRAPAAGGGRHEPCEAIALGMNQTRKRYENTLQKD